MIERRQLVSENALVDATASVATALDTRIAPFTMRDGCVFIDSPIAKMTEPNFALSFDVPECGLPTCVRINPDIVKLKSGDVITYGDLTFKIP